MEMHFLAEGKINKEVLEELKKYIIPPDLVNLTNGFMIFFGVLAVLFLIAKATFVSSVGFLGVITLYLVSVIGRRNCISKVLKVIKTDSKEIAYTLHFYDEFFTIGSKEQEGPKIYYVHIKRLAETERYYAFFMKGDMCIPISKDSLEGNVEIEGNEEDEWLGFMVACNNKMKMQIKL